MKFVIQRVTKAKCEVNHEITGAIEQGFCVLIGVAETDNEQIADKMIKKCYNVGIWLKRVFNFTIQMVDRLMQILLLQNLQYCHLNQVSN